jgi:hypothetical protein
MAKNNIASDFAHFRSFATNLEYAISQYSVSETEDLLDRQIRELKLLFSLEEEFRKALIKHPWGPSSYKAFMDFILHDKKNILAARPYFRERQSVFSAEISKALKKESDKGLYKFRINYPFVNFIMKSKNWKGSRFGAKLVDLAARIESIRTEIVELNMPLAVSQARIFYSCTPKGHLSYMDLIQIHVGGLLVAVDKFSISPKCKDPKVWQSFRAVIVGRMWGDRIACSSETLIHFFPSDSRKIYRALKARRRCDTSEGVDYELLTSKVNEGIANPSHKTNPAEIAQLISAASCVSGDVALDLGGETVLDRESDLFELQPDSLVEEREAESAVRSKYQDLTFVERKLLRLKGVPV